MELYAPFLLRQRNGPQLSRIGTREDRLIQLTNCGWGSGCARPSRARKIKVKAWRVISAARTGLGMNPCPPDSMAFSRDFKSLWLVTNNIGVCAFNGIS